MNEKKLISIIGGNGFLGSYLVNELLNKGYYIKIISRTATLSKKNLLLINQASINLLIVISKTMNY